MSLSGEHILTGHPAAGAPLFDVSGEMAVSVLDAEDVIDKLNGGSGTAYPRDRDSGNPFAVNFDGVVDQNDYQAVVDYLYAAAITYPAEFDEIHIRTHGGNDMAGIAYYASSPNPIAHGAPAWIFGGDGDDILGGTPYDDYLDGGDGNDQLGAGDKGNDTIIGGGGNDGSSG